MVEKFEVGKWYDTKEHVTFNGPAKCLRKCVHKGFFGEVHDGWWNATSAFVEVPAPESVTIENCTSDSCTQIDADTLDEAIRIRNAAIDAATAQIKALMDYDKAIRVKEVIPADVRESIKIIFTRGEKGE